jgi:hypothetical protein
VEVENEVGWDRPYWYQEEEEMRQPLLPWYLRVVDTSQAVEYGQIVERFGLELEEVGWMLVLKPVK